MSPRAWIAAAAVVPVAGACAASPFLARGEAVWQGALAALPVSGAAGAGVLAGVRRASILPLVLAVAGSAALRIGAVVAGGIIAHRLLGPEAWLAAFLSLAACIIAGFVVESAIAFRLLTREIPRD